jgi:predicted NUDIX family NTP pyrophosphohydrolase
MKKKSAGILLYRTRDLKIEVFLVHPGGPFWAKKDEHAWSIPKGEYSDEEAPADAALREFAEETGIKLSGELIELTPVMQKGGKMIFCYALEGDLDPRKIISNTFEMEWPPRSGKRQSFPETDRGEWFGLPEAKMKINSAQAALVDELEKILFNRV